jgi:hypothetical protein
LRSRKNEELQEVEYRNLYGFGKSIASWDKNEIKIYYKCIRIGKD